jgi:hypothetical protein
LGLSLSIFLLPLYPLHFPPSPLGFFWTQRLAAALDTAV